MFSGMLTKYCQYHGFGLVSLFISNLKVPRAHAENGPFAEVFWRAKTTMGLCPGASPALRSTTIMIS